MGHNSCAGGLNVERYFHDPSSRATNMANKIP